MAWRSWCERSRRCPDRRALGWLILAGSAFAIYRLGWKENIRLALDVGRDFRCGGAGVLAGDGVSSSPDRHLSFNIIYIIIVDMSEPARPPPRHHGHPARSRNAAANGIARRRFATIVPHTIEEAYEVADAVARGDIDDIRDELGDLLFQVVFQARIAEEAGQFDFDDVARSIADKLEARHPHIFGRTPSRARAQTATRAGKRSRRPSAPRKGATSALDGVAPRAAGADARRKAAEARRARSGSTGPIAEGPAAKVAEEMDELAEAADRRSASRKPATCCSPRSIWSALTASRRKTRCAPPTPSSNAVSGRWKPWRAATFAELLAR